MQSLVVAWLSYTVFTMYAGSRGVILTDTLMFLLFMIATFLVVAFIVNDLGGVPSAIEGMARLDEKPGIASWHGVVGPGTVWPTAMDYLIWTLIMDNAWGVVYSVSPWQSSRHLMARNEHVVIRAAVYACLAVAFLQIAVYGTGGVVNLVNASITPSENVMIWAAKNMVPEFLGALLLAGIMAAALSSASTFLSLIGFSASNDIVQRKEQDEKKLLSFTRMMMLAIGIVALVTSFFFPPSLFWVTYFVGTVFASSWGPVGFMSIWSSRITADGAFWGIVSGFIFNVAPTFLDYLEIISLPSYLHPILIGAAVSLVVTVFVSRQGTVSREEKTYRMQLHRTPADEIDQKKTRITMVAPGILIAYGCIMPFVMLHWYVRPYQTGTGQLLPDGSIDFATGEAFVTLTWAAIYIPLGFITAKVIRNSYSPGAKVRNNRFASEKPA